MKQREILKQRGMLTQRRAPFKEGEAPAALQTGKRIQPSARCGKPRGMKLIIISAARIKICEQAPA